MTGGPETAHSHEEEAAASSHPDEVCKRAEIAADRLSRRVARLNSGSTLEDEDDASFDDAMAQLEVVTNSMGTIEKTLEGLENGEDNSKTKTHRMNAEINLGRLSSEKSKLTDIAEDYIRAVKAKSSNVTTRRYDRFQNRIDKSKNERQKLRRIEQRGEFLEGENENAREVEIQSRRETAVAHAAFHEEEAEAAEKALAQALDGLSNEVNEEGVDTQLAAEARLEEAMKDPEKLRDGLTFRQRMDQLVGDMLFKGSDSLVDDLQSDNVFERENKMKWKGTFIQVVMGMASSDPEWARELLTDEYQMENDALKYGFGMVVSETEGKVSVDFDETLIKEEFRSPTVAWARLRKVAGKDNADEVFSILSVVAGEDRGMNKAELGAWILAPENAGHKQKDVMQAILTGLPEGTKDEAVVLSVLQNGEFEGEVLVVEEEEVELGGEKSMWNELFKHITPGISFEDYSNKLINDNAFIDRMNGLSQEEIQHEIEEMGLDSNSTLRDVIRGQITKEDEEGQEAEIFLSFIENGEIDADQLETSIALLSPEGKRFLQRGFPLIEEGRFDSLIEALGVESGEINTELLNAACVEFNSFLKNELKEFHEHLKEFIDTKLIMIIDNFEGQAFYPHLKAALEKE
jgi:hypothetical protein